MLTLSLQRPPSWTSYTPCWQLNSLRQLCAGRAGDCPSTSPCSDSCDRKFWKGQALFDIGVSGDYFNLDQSYPELATRFDVEKEGGEERYLQVASRWYALPGSERYIDQGLAQLFAARDQDKCMLTYLLTFDQENWQNALIGAALSGNQNIFSSVLTEKFTSVDNYGVDYLYSLYPAPFRSRLERAAALGGNEQIFTYLVPDLSSFTDLEALVQGGNLNLIRQVLEGREKEDTSSFSLLSSAFYSGREDVVSYLSSLSSLPLSGFTEVAASSGNLDLLNFTGREDEEALLYGFARAGNKEYLRDIPSSFLEGVLESALESTSPARYDIAKRCLEKGARVSSSMVRKAVRTGDVDLVSLLNSPLSEDYIYDAISTGSLEMVKLFPGLKGSVYSSYAAELGFGEINIMLTR
ncbi:hypothetical protein BQ9231_00416 [Cedratvirus lausannensis]|uniref:Ankyrin repeat n=1 Tax=Cedratvirus lausannensis TaxID=2023205 RepID=A0A285PXF3_9VIRU|nr:hypothetical protein BQ9231_00416 [Cedratvirus lausannensis]